MLKYLKLIPVGLVFLAAALLVGLGVIFGARGCGGRQSPAPALGSAPAGAPPGWTAPPVETTPLVENPLKKSTAGKKTAALPAGSTLVEIKPHGAETVQVAILPDGQVIVPDGMDAVVYQKRAALMALELRPIIGGGFTAASTFGPAVMAGADVIRLGPARVGAGAMVGPFKPLSVAGGATVGADVYKNVGVRGFAGAGNRGWTFGAAAVISIVKPARR